MSKRFNLDDWNARHPIGTAVEYTPSIGALPVLTKTRSVAWLLGHGEPVVLLEGRTGGCSLNFVKPVEET